MGYGHQRIAAAAASWLSALTAAGGSQSSGKEARSGESAGAGAKPAARGAAARGGATVSCAPAPASIVMHDLTGLDCPEAALITRADRRDSVDGGDADEGDRRDSVDGGDADEGVRRPIFMELIYLPTDVRRGLPTLNGLGTSRGSQAGPSV